MLFNSYAFVFAFLPLFVAGFYTVSHVTKSYCLQNKADGLTYEKPACVPNAVELYCVIFSFIFFAFFGVKVLGVFVISLVWNGIVLYLLKSDINTKAKIEASDISVSTKNQNISDFKSKPLLIIGICGNIALLLFFKYAGFFAEIISAI